MRIPLGTQWTVTTTNDGSVYLSRKGQHTDSDRYGTVPLISLEAKRRHAGGIRRPAGISKLWSSLDISCSKVKYNDIAPRLLKTSRYLFSAQYGDTDRYENEESRARYITVCSPGSFRSSTTVMGNLLLLLLLLL
ncbi:hypothetical protein M432DRAFT_187961 [Thermoascus aurantiacus ATCC 26904]